jgi:hypothetical protein
MDMKYRLSVDVDSADINAVKSYFNMKYIFGDVEIYRTGRGFHFITDRPTDLTHRMALGDDPMRVMLSELRYRASGELDDVTFDVKLGHGRRKRIGEEEFLECVFEEADREWCLRRYSKQMRWNLRKQKRN